MRDPAVRLDVAAVLEEIVQFLTLRRRWLAPTQYDWTDVDKRAWLAFHLGRPMRWYVPVKRLSIELRPETELSRPADVPDDIRVWLDEPKRLLPGRAAQTGRLAPRNVAIVGALKIALRHGFDLTRNPGQKKKNNSACSIVRQALARVGVDLTERHIQRIGANASLSI